MRIFNFIVRANSGIEEMNIPSTNKSGALKVAKAVGNVVAYKDITSEQFTMETPAMVETVLSNNGFGDAESKLIAALVLAHIEKNCACAKAENVNENETEDVSEDVPEVTE